MTAVDVAPPRLTRRDVVRSALLAMVVGSIFGIAALAHAGDTAPPYRNSDGLAFEYVAEDPFGDGSRLADDERVDGNAYRMGRILYPAAAWVLAVGQPAGALTALVALAVLGFAASVFFAALLVRSRGAPIVLAIVVVCTPFAIRWLTEPWAVGEPLVLALLLAAALAYSRDRVMLAIGIAALVILTRESAAIAFLPLCFLDWRVQGWRFASRWLLALVPYGLWCVWLRVQVGEFPFTDPVASRRDAFGIPFGGAFDVLSKPFGQWQGVVILAGAITVGLAFYVWRRMSWTPVTQMALALAAVIVCFGPSVWGLWGEALRVMAPAQGLVLLALAIGIARPRPRTVK